MGPGSNMIASHDNAGIAASRFNMNAQIASYEDCQRAMELLGDGNGFAKIGPRMTLIFEGHDQDPDQASRTYAVELYHTKIIRYYPDGTFSVSNGGFATPTTRERLQAVLPEGFIAYHHSTPYLKRRLGLEKLSGDGSRTFPGRGKTQPEGVLWPLDHHVRIDAKTGRKVETGGAA